MPYAADNQISKTPIAGGIEITDTEYQQVVEAISNGYAIRIVDNQMQFILAEDLITEYWINSTTSEFAPTPEDVPPGATTVPLPSEFYELVNGEWVFDFEAFRQDKIEFVKQEGLQRVQAVIPGVVSFDMLLLVREFWLSIAPAARSPTVNFQYAIDVYVAGKNAIIYLNNPARTQAEIEAYNPIIDPAWPQAI